MNGPHVPHGDEIAVTVSIEAAPDWDGPLLVIGIPNMGEVGIASPIAAEQLGHLILSMAAELRRLTAGAN